MSAPSKPASVIGKETPPISKTGVLGLLGDLRILQPGQTATIIDAEWATPRVLLITGDAEGITGLWTIRSGIKRASLATEDGIQASTLSRVVIASSIQVVVKNEAPPGGLVLKARCIVTPIDATIDVTKILGVEPAAPEGPPNAGQAGSFPQSVTPITFSQGSGIYAEGNYSGLSIYNATAANLFVLIGDGNADIVSNWTIKIVPGGYYETPFGFNGHVSGIWDAAGAGTAQVTINSFQS